MMRPLANLALVALVTFRSCPGATAQTIPCDCDRLRAIRWEQEHEAARQRERAERAEAVAALSVVLALFIGGVAVAAASNGER